MRIVFLDWDGVLNHAGTWARVERAHPQLPGGGFAGEPRTEVERLAEASEPACVARVAALVVEFGAVVAVVSSWRERMSRAELADALRLAGMPGGVSVAACSRGCSKGEAVARFLAQMSERNRPARSFVVVDDSPGILPGGASRHVKPCGSVGFTEADLVAARRILATDL